VTLLLVTSSANAKPPSFAKAKQVAAAWLRAMRKGHAAKSSSADISIAIDSDECHGVFHHDTLADAAECIARTFAGYGPAHWKPYITMDDERLLTGDMTGKDAKGFAALHVSAAGEVTEVRVGIYAP
jgi:hypothetical protein